MMNRKAWIQGLVFALGVSTVLVSSCGIGIGVNDRVALDQNGDSVVTSTPIPTATPIVRILDASWISLSQLKLYYKLDEVSAIDGISVVDSSSSGLSSSLSTGDIFAKDTVGKVSGAILFDGTDDHVITSDPGVASVIDFAGGDAITLSVWIMPMLLPTAGTQIITKGGTAGTNNVNYGLQTGDGTGTTGNKFSFYYYDGGGWHVYSSDVAHLATAIWRHLAVTYTFGSPASAVLYVDGVAVSGSWSVGTGINSPIQNNEPLWLGASNAPGGPSIEFPFQGMIDEVSVWKRALTATEIADIFARPSL